MDKQTNKKTEEDLMKEEPDDDNPCPLQSNPFTGVLCALKLQWLL
jgi:hypothetical protein